jgi:general secretion pathway protein D
MHWFCTRSDFEVPPMIAAMFKIICHVSLVTLLCCCAIDAQQVTTAMPFNNGGTSFHENFGIGWNVNIPTANPALGGRGVVGLGPNGPQQGINFGFGGPNVAPPPFGLGQPGNGGQLGWQVSNGNGARASFNIFADQGSSRTMTSQTPMITTMNGMPGFFADTVQRPFVTSLIPVVGDRRIVYPSVNVPWPGANGTQQGTSILNERLARLKAEPTRHQAAQPDVAPVARTATPQNTGKSSAERGAQKSLAEIRREQQAEAVASEAEVEDLLQQAATAFQQQELALTREILKQIGQRGSPEQQARVARARELLQQK